MSTTAAPARKLASALDKCRRKVSGLSDSALNAAAAASIALGQNDGTGYPTEYVRKRVGLVLTELESLERVAGELDDAPKSGIGLLVRALRARAFHHPKAARSVIEARLGAYCAARGSGTEWRRPASSDAIRRAG
jgi:hypothetical protein